MGLHHHGPSPTSKTNDTHTRSHDFHHHRKRDTHAGDSHHHGNSDHLHQADAHLERDHKAVHIEEEHHVEPYQWYCMVLLLGKVVFLLGKIIYLTSLSLSLFYFLSLPISLWRMQVTQILAFSIGYILIW